MGHRSVLEVGRRGERRNLPVGGQAPFLEWGKNLKALGAVGAVAGLSHVTNALGPRPKIVLKGGCFLVPGGPEHAVEVLELADFHEAEFLFVQLPVVGTSLVLPRGADEMPAGVVGPGV